MSDALGVGIGNAIEGGLNEWHSSLARKFQHQQADVALQEARRRDELNRQIALVRAEAQTHAADTSAGARRYAADQGYSGRTDAANTNAESRGNVADISAGARRYSADQGVAGRKYGADKSLEGAKARAGATMGAAKVNAGARIDAANIGAGASQNRSIMSLFGQMNRPRNLGMDEKGKAITSPAPPKFTDWMQQSGLPAMSPQGMGAPAGAAPVLKVAPHHRSAGEQIIQQYKEAAARGDQGAMKALEPQAQALIQQIQKAPAAAAVVPEDDEDENDDYGTGEDDDDDPGVP